MDELKKEAEALGIDVDGRWGEARLRQEIERARQHEAAKDEEGDAYGNETDDAGEDAGEGSGGTEARGEPADDRDGDAGDDAEGSARGGDEGGAVDDAPQEDAVSAGGADVPAGGDTGGEAAVGDAAPIAAGEADGTDDDAARGDGGSNPTAPDDGAGEPTGADGDPAPQGVAQLAAGDADAAHQPADAAGAPQDHGDGSADGAEAPDAAALNGESDALGGLPTSPALLDEDAKRVAIETARTAMTAPIVAAFNAASAMAGDAGFDASWFAREGDVGDYLPALVEVAVPFVREWPTAPVEALYSHVARAAPALRHEERWDDLHFSHRLAWDVFRDVLVKADAAIDAETRRREAAEASDRWGQRDTHEDDTMFAPSTSREQRSDLGQARDGAMHMTATEVRRLREGAAEKQSASSPTA